MLEGYSLKRSSTGITIIQQMDESECGLESGKL